jgi:hypothetical protein
MALVCKCGKVLSDGRVIKGIAIMEFDSEKKWVNVKCRGCKKWYRLLFTDLMEDMNGNRLT